MERDMVFYLKTGEMASGKLLLMPCLGVWVRPFLLASPHETDGRMRIKPMPAMTKQTTKKTGHALVGRHIQGGKNRK
jgi:hypothetical protein